MDALWSRNFDSAPNRIVRNAGLVGDLDSYISVVLGGGGDAVSDAMEMVCICYGVHLQHQSYLIADRSKQTRTLYQIRVL